MTETCTIALSEWIFQAVALEKQGQLASGVSFDYLEAAVKIASLLTELISSATTTGHFERATTETAPNQDGWAVNRTSSVEQYECSQNNNVTWEKKSSSNRYFNVSDLASSLDRASVDSGTDSSAPFNSKDKSIRNFSDLLTVLTDEGINDSCTKKINDIASEILNINNVSVTIAKQKHPAGNGESALVAKRQEESLKVAVSNHYDKEGNKTESVKRNKKKNLGLDPCMGFFSKYDDKTILSAAQELANAEAKELQQRKEAERRNEEQKYMEKKKNLQRKQRIEANYGMGFFSQGICDQLETQIRQDSELDISAGQRNAMDETKRLELVDGVHFSDPRSASQLAYIRESEGDHSCLHFLGHIFYYLFTRGKKLSGFTDTQIITETNMHQKKRALNSSTTERQIFDSLEKFGLPYSICRLVSDLIASQTSHRTDYTEPFQSLIDLRCDVDQMIKKPKVFLYDFPVNMPIQVQFHCDMYGRDRESTAIFEAAKRISSTLLPEKNEAVFVQGHSGSGKSRLIHSFKTKLANESPANWQFLQCKFDRMEQTKPFSVITSAFNIWLNSMSNAPERCQKLIHSVRQAVGPNGLVLLFDLFPSLKEMCQNNSDAIPPCLAKLTSASIFTIDVDKAKHRLMYLFRTVFEVVLQFEFKVIFFVDDLQWADEGTLELIQELVEVSSFGSVIDGQRNIYSKFLFIGCYRDNEVDKDHPLSALMTRLYKQNESVNITNINLSRLSCDSVNHIISELLRLPCRVTRSLSELVFKKTVGNPLFVIEFIKSLLKAGHLRFDRIDKRWVWDNIVIELVKVKESVAEFMVGRLQHLPEEEKEGLKIASCFGSQINTLFLSFIDDVTAPPGLIQSLYSAVDLGYLDKAGPLLMFAHDSVQEAAYSLIPAENRQQIHFKLGLSIYEKAESAGELMDFVLVVANQINRAGQSIVKNPKQRIDFAKLNKLAGEVSLSEQSFESASYYFQSGLAFLDGSHWYSDYDLTLRLHEASALTLFIIGRLGELIKFLPKVLDYALCIEHKISSLLLLLKCRAFSGDINEAVKIGLSAIAELGETIPANPCPPDVLKVVTETQSQLKQLSEENILNFPQMADIKTRYAMKAIDAISPFVYGVNPSLFAILVCRMVNITISRRVMCEEFPFAIAMFGMIHVSMNCVEEGYQLGKLAVHILRHNSTSSQNARVFTAAGILSTWVDPLRKSIDTFDFGIKEGFLCGDVEWAMMSILHKIQAYLYFGTRLKTIGKATSDYCQLLLRYQNFGLLENAVIYHSMFLRLTGRKDNPFVVFGGKLNSEEDILQAALSCNNSAFVLRIYLQRLFIAFIFRDMETARESTRKIETTKIPEVLAALYIFYEGLTAFHFARNSNEMASWYSIGTAAISKFERWATISKCNFENKLLLLQAENFFTRHEHHKAESSYELAIASASKHHFVHEEAIARELAFSFFFETGDRIKAESYLLRSNNLYLQWGAVAKAELLKPNRLT